MNPLSKLGLQVFAVLALLTGAVLWHNAALDTALDAAKEDGRTIERAVWTEKERLRSEAEKLALVNHQETLNLIRKANDARNIQLANDHEQALATVRKAAAADDISLLDAGGLRVPRSICDAIGTGAETSSDGDHDAYLAATVQLPHETEQFLKSEADRADEIVETARECQNWVRAQGFYGDPPR